MRHKATQWAQALKQQVLAPRCVLCRAPAGLNLDLCAACHAELPFLEHFCSTCALPLPAHSTQRLCNHCQNRPLFDHAYGAFAYRQPIQWLIVQLKFKRRRHFARLLGQLLAEQLIHHNAPRPDAIVPVPLHKKRYRWRGFNQAELLAEPVSRQLDIPIYPKLAMRTRATQPQLALPASQRQHNVRGAFRASPKVRGLHIAILDDVVTTGHTTANLAQALLEQGAASVQLWCIARAEKPEGTRHD